MERKCYRAHDADPMYTSTENWKTIEQWDLCGYTLKPRNQLAKIKVNWILYGYNSAYCQWRIRRIHRLAMRKKYVRKVCK